MLIPNITVDDILIQNYGHVYLAAQGHGVFLYDEVSQTYSTKNTGIQGNINITDLAVSPGGYLFSINQIGYNCTVYKSIDSIITGNKAIETNKMIDISNYPNPFSNATTININFPDGEVSAKLYLSLINSGGNLIKEVQLKNTNKFYLSDNIPNGIYYVIIRSGKYRACHKIIKIN